MNPPNPQQPVNILLVDDHPLVRRGLRHLFQGESDLHVCGEAEDVPSAMQQIAMQRPDLVIVDLSLKTGHGLDLLQRIRCRDPEIQMIVLSMHEDDVYAERTLRAGARGYVNKGETGERVLEAIRAVMAGEIFLSPAMTARCLRRKTDAETEDRDPTEKLSDRELTVFELIGRGLSTREIASHLQLSVKTIETYREHIKSKLKLAGASELSRDAARWVFERDRREAGSIIHA